MTEVLEGGSFNLCELNTDLFRRSCQLTAARYRRGRAKMLLSDSPGGLVDVLQPKL